LETAAWRQAHERANTSAWITAQLFFCIFCSASTLSAPAYSASASGLTFAALPPLRPPPLPPPPPPLPPLRPPPLPPLRPLPLPPPLRPLPLPHLRSSTSALLCALLLRLLLCALFLCLICGPPPLRPPLPAMISPDLRMPKKAWEGEAAPAQTPTITAAATAAKRAKLSGGSAAAGRLAKPSALSTASLPRRRPGGPARVGPLPAIVAEANPCVGEATNRTRSRAKAAAAVANATDARPRAYALTTYAWPSGSSARPLRPSGPGS